VTCTCKTVLWDWNGTLFNDAHLCVEIMNRQLSHRRLPTLTLDRYRDLFDFPVRIYYDRLGFDFERESFEVVGTEFIRLYESRKYEAGLRSDTRQVLEALRQKGIGQAVLSAYKHDTLVELIEHFQLGGYFTHLSGLDNHYAHSKVDNGLELIKQLGSDPQHTVMIGDTIHDYEVAQAMGTGCILVEGGHHPRYKLDSCKVPVVPTLEAALKQIIGR